MREQRSCWAYMKPCRSATSCNRICACETATRTSWSCPTVILACSSRNEKTKQAVRSLNSSHSILTFCYSRAVKRTANSRLASIESDSYLMKRVSDEACFLNAMCAVSSNALHVESFALKCSCEIDKAPFYRPFLLRTTGFLLFQDCVNDSCRIGEMLFALFGVDIALDKSHIVRYVMQGYACEGRVCCKTHDKGLPLEIWRNFHISDGSINMNATRKNASG